MGGLRAGARRCIWVRLLALLIIQVDIFYALLTPIVRYTFYLWKPGIPVAGPKIWNDLPEDVTSAPSLLSFRQRLETFSFRRSYPYLIFDCLTIQWS
jgi:hypothetical protein